MDGGVICLSPAHLLGACLHPSAPGSGQGESRAAGAGAGLGHREFTGAASATARGAPLRAERAARPPPPPPAKGGKGLGQRFPPPFPHRHTARGWGGRRGGRLLQSRKYFSLLFRSAGVKGLGCGGVCSGKEGWGCAFVFGGGFPPLPLLSPFAPAQPFRSPPARRAEPAAPALAARAERRPRRLARGRRQSAAPASAAPRPRRGRRGQGPSPGAQGLEGPWRGGVDWRAPPPRVGRSPAGVGRRRGGRCGRPGG